MYAELLARMNSIQVILAIQASTGMLAPIVSIHALFISEMVEVAN